MRFGSTFLWAVAASLAGTGLFMLKFQVQAEDERLAEINHEITDTRQAIHVLNAEWSFLNDPARLSDEAERLLALQPLGPKQIGMIEQVPMAAPAAPGAVPTPVMEPPAGNAMVSSLSPSRPIAPVADRIVTLARGVKQ